MINKSNFLTNLPIWQALCEHQQKLARLHMRDWFHAEPNRSQQYSVSCGGLLLDYSRNRINQTTLSLLTQLAKDAHLPKKIESLFNGEEVNRTEKRAALHTALRNHHHSISINGQAIAPQIANTLAHMRDFCQQIHGQRWHGVTGKPIKHVVNIGIGGSHLGPKMTCQALKESAVSPLCFHFVSSIDECLLNDVWEQIDPEATLFIISSKTFGTLETITNAKTILNHMQAKWGKAVLKHHFIAVTANQTTAASLGIPAENIFPIWEWVNGRYSIWSAIGLPLMLMIGADGFADFHAGAHAMDQHFRQTDFAHNMPVILALLGIWYQNFFHSQTHAIIPYSYRLREFISYLQQAEMESNGKNIDLAGNPITYATSPVIFGEEGSNGQHSYHQLLHQGQHLVPADIILVGKLSSSHQPLLEMKDHHDILVSSGLSQAQALMQGKTYQEAHAELLAANYSPTDADYLAKHKVIPGNRPSNVLFLDRLTPKNLGAMLALYEHKIFVQGAIWNINSFDQWGVELGKQLLPNILQRLQTKPENLVDSADSEFNTHFHKIAEKV